MSSKTILIIALDFPPCKSAGVQRTLLFCKYLKKYGWNPVVLTVNSDAHLQHDNSTTQELDFPIYRAFTLNSKRDLSIRGKTLMWLQSPDKFWLWYYSAVPLGLKLIDKYKPDVIWSTYPVLTAHRIASKLSQKSGIKWVADYRDPVQARYDGNQQLTPLTRKVEAKSIKQAAKVVFTTKQASLLYQSAYSDIDCEKFSVIPNGYYKLSNKPIIQPKNKQYTLLHSGAVYENGRDPTQLFFALSMLKKSATLNKDNFSLVFRGCEGERFDELITELDITDIVVFLPSIPYQESIIEMENASALLVLQGELFTNQVPGKLYEYLATHKPILCICPTGSATHTEIYDLANCFQANQKKQIQEVLIEMLGNIEFIERDIERFSRKNGAMKLISLLESLN